MNRRLFLFGVMFFAVTAIFSACDNSSSDVISGSIDDPVDDITDDPVDGGIDDPADDVVDDPTDGDVYTPPDDGISEKIFELDITGTQVNYSDTPHPGGGYISFLANPENGAGDGINGTNIYIVDITDDPLLSTPKKGLRNVYKRGGEDYSFGNQTVFIRHPDIRKFYMRMRIKWSSNWEWGTDQLKFCKNKGSGISTNCPKFNGDGELVITKLAEVQPGLNEKYVYAVMAGIPDDYHVEDDINNEFGGSGTDANWSPNLDQWYWLEWEIDAGTLGQSDGSYRVWVDGELYMSLDNVQVGEDGDSYFNSHELGHVWQGGIPSQDIYMEWHSIEIFSQRPSEAN